jgi:UDP-glucose 4-epimerase
MNEITGKNILVTGGAGFIGSHLVDRLVEEHPNKIVVVDNLFLGRLENLESAKATYDNLIIYIRDASIFSVLEEIIRKEEIGTVFDLATIPLPTSYVQPIWTYENNIRLVLNFCELLWKAKFDFYVHCSSSEAYGTAQFVPMTENHPLNPTTTYGASKASQDLLIQAFDRMYDLNFFIFRPFNNFGERQNDQAYAGVIPLTIKRLLKGEKPVQYGDGKQTRDFIYVKDTVDAVVRASKSPKCREVEIGNLIRLICERMGYNGEIEVTKNPRANDVRRHFASNEKLKSIIDFNPTDLEAAIDKIIGWYRH